MRADPKIVRRLLNTAKGQIDGILKMVEEDRYCPEISHQILASIAVLKRANQTILKAHLEGCVLESINEDGKEKIAEIVELMEKLS